MSKPTEAELRAAYSACNGNHRRAHGVILKAHPGYSYDTMRNRFYSLGLRGMGKGGTVTAHPGEQVVREAYAAHNGHVTRMADALGVAQSTASNWIKSLGLRGAGQFAYQSVYPQVIADTLDDGYVVCFSDAHLWFEEKSRAHEALLSACKKLKPAIVVANGDVLDGARISRHDPSGLDPTPDRKSVV